MTAVTFALMDLYTGKLAGIGVICTAARYCSLKHIGGGRLERRFLPLTQWRDVEREIAEQLPAAALDPDSAIALALNGMNKLVIQYLNAMPITAEPLQVTTALDAHLMAQSTEI